MEKTLKKFIRQAITSSFVKDSVTRFVRFYSRINPLWRPYLSHELQVPLLVDPNTSRFLDEIPSETTLNERRFLYQFFSTIWSGKNDVVEIGPFLGGTTRAIALGMCHNPRKGENKKLFTYDRFRNYYNVEQLRNYLALWFQSGLLKKDDVDSLGEAGEFIDIFIRLHSKHDYYTHINLVNNGIPDRVEDERQDQQYLRFSEEMVTDAVFVDGCKSWYGTKYFMQEVSKIALPGSYFIFQDYGWYTCFWIPAFLELFRDYFQLIAHVDATYTFLLKKSLIAEEISKVIPDNPANLGETVLGKLFDQRIDDAVTRNDYFAIVRHTIQKAGAFAYIGNKPRAKGILLELNKMPWAASQRKIILTALRSPTYTPDGPIYLDE